MMLKKKKIPSGKDEPNKIIRAVAYIRVSTEEQARQGVSFSAQTACIRAYAESQHWQLVKVYSDEYTGTTLDRPGFSEMALDITDGKIDAVLVYKLDRLARSQRLILRILEDVFEAQGVAFKSVTEPFDTCSAMGKAFLGMLAVFAQLERDTIVERTKDALRHKKEIGQHCGRIPYGFRIGESGKLEKDIAAQKVISRIKRLSRSGMSVRKISKMVLIPKSTIHEFINTSQRGRNSKYVGNLSP